MFDQLTEELDARGESSNDGEGDSTCNLKKLRNKMEILNSDLHEIYEGEDACEGEGDDGDEVVHKGMDITD